jgi:hypothetical protein
MNVLNKDLYSFEGMGEDGMLRHTAQVRRDRKSEVERRREVGGKRCMTS